MNKRRQKALLNATAPDLLDTLIAIARECGVMASHCSKLNDTFNLKQYAELQRIATNAVIKATEETKP